MKTNAILNVAKVIVLLAVMSNEQVAGQKYVVTDISVPGAEYTTVFGLNNLGQAVGQYISGNTLGAFLYSDGLTRSLDALGKGAEAYGINDAGQIVGRAIFGSAYHAFLYQNGVIQNIGDTNTISDTAYGINNKGQVIIDTRDRYTASLWSNGSRVSLGDLGGGFGSLANAINDKGHVVGLSYYSYSYDAFLWQNGSMKDLGALPHSDFGIAYAINNKDQIVGFGGNTATLWQNGSILNLGALPNLWYSYAYGINDNGQIVGSSDRGNNDGSGDAFLYSDGVMRDLNDLLVNRNSVWRLIEARAINNKGQIAGTGTNLNGQSRSFLLNPIPSGAVEAVSNAVPVYPTYGNLPVKDPTKDSLVVVTHGWQLKLIDVFGHAYPQPDVSFVDSMSNNISTYLTNHGINNWQVYGYKWVDNAWKLDPSDALVNAIKEGQTLGNSIVTQGWTHVHFIAHSAGAGLIQAATDVIKKPGSASFSTVVHETFLDAFVGSDFAGVVTYGRGADWADSYFTRDKETGYDPFANLFTIAPYTESPVFHSYNVDVTFLDTNKISYTKFTSSTSGIQIVETCHDTETSHGWPIDFYTNTIVGNVTSNYLGFGFPLSEESTNWSARSEYLTGNGTDIHPDIPTQVLGIPDSECTIIGQISYPTYSDTTPDPTQTSSADSLTGSIQKQPKYIHLHSGSPVWTAMFVSSTNPVNFVSFDAEFTDTNSAQGLLSVYWDTNTVGTVDERVVQSGSQHYLLKFPNASPNSLHVLGFRLDPFTTAQSSILLTNIVLNQVGVSRPFSLSVTTNTVNGQQVLRLDGEAGFNYNIQAVSDLTNTNWNQIAILANTNGTVFFYDRDSTNYIQRFYRVVVP